MLLNRHTAQQTTFHIHTQSKPSTHRDMRLLKSSSGGPCPFALPHCAVFGWADGPDSDVLVLGSTGEEQAGPCAGKGRTLKCVPQSTVADQTQSHARWEQAVVTSVRHARWHLWHVCVCRADARAHAQPHVQQPDTVHFCTPSRRQRPNAIPAAEVSAGDVCAKARLRTQSRCPVRRQQREKSPPPGGATSSVIAASTPPSASSSLFRPPDTESIRPLEIMHHLCY